MARRIIWKKKSSTFPSKIEWWLLYASFTPVRHLCSVARHPSSVISRPLQSLPFTPIRLSRAVDTDFCVPTVLNRYSPGKWLTEALSVGNSLPTAHYHDLWSASAIRRPLKSLPDRLCVNGLSYFLSERFWLKRTTDDWSGRRMVWRTGVNGALQVGLYKDSFSFRSLCS